MQQKRKKTAWAGQNVSEPTSAEQRARELLELYFAGETTLADEKFLKEFFSGESVPADLLYAGTMFASFGAAAMLGSRKDEILFSSDNHALGEHSTPDVQADAGTEISDGTLRRRLKMRRIYISASAAAIILFAVGITWMLIPAKPTVYCYLNGEPVTSIEAAARHANMATRLLECNAKVSADGASSINRAVKPLQRIDDILERLGQESDELQEKGQSPTP